MHPKDHETYPEGTVVRWKGKTAIIRHRTFQKDGKGFLNYLAEVEGREGTYAIYHADIEQVIKIF